MKNKNLFWAGCILLAAIILRFICLDKTGGLWYDELVSYKEAAQNSVLSTIFYTLKTDVHLPLYPVLLHMWGKIFSLSDTALRAFSAVCGIGTVILAYLTGKKLKSENTGLWCAGIFALNSFLIYYSQEVRLYSLLMMFAVLLSYAAVSIFQNTERKTWYIIFSLVSAALIYTYTIAFIYVLALAAVLFFLKYKNKDNLKPLNISLISMLVLCLPAIYHLIVNHKNYTNQINGYYCDWSSLFVVIQNWFSPMLEGLTNNPVHYMEYLFTNLSLSSVVFIFIPVILSIGLIIYAVKKEQKAAWLLIPSLIFILAEIIAFKFTNFKILARYLSIALPNLLIMVGLGISLLPDKKKINIIIPSLLIIINLSYLIFAGNAAYKLPRNGFRPLAELINEQNLKSGDYVVVWNRKEVLDKYCDVENINLLSILKDFAYRSEKILGHEEELNRLPLDERKKVLRAYFEDVNPAKNNVMFLSFIFSRMSKGQKFIITSNAYFDKYSPEEFVKAVENDAEYNRLSYNDLLTIKSLITIKEMCLYNLDFVGRYDKSGNTIFVFEKK